MISPIKIFGVLLGVALILTLPFLLILAHSAPGSTDLVFYSLCIKLFSAQFWQGDLYPRWLMDANGGLGSPVFYFYPPLVYYLASTLQFLSKIDPFGTLRLGLAMFASQVAAGGAMVFWLRRHLPQGAALLAGVLYIALPYKFTYIYIHTTLVQCFAMVWMPLLLLAADRIIARKPLAWAHYSALFALLVFTHIPSVITFSAIPLAYVLVMSDAKSRLRNLLYTALAAALGLALSAVYWLPAMLAKQYVHTEEMLEGRFNYQAAIFHTDMFYAMPYLALAGLMAASLRRATHPVLVQNRRLLWWCFAVLGAVFFLTLPLSKFIWDAIPLLHYVQFPSARFFAPLLLCASALTAALLMYVTPRPRVWITFAVLMITASWFHIHKTEILLTQWYAKDVRIWRDDTYATRTMTPPEYRTRWTAPKTLTVDKIRTIYASQPQVRAAKGKAESAVEQWNSGQIMLRINVHSARAELVLHQLYFPRWMATADGAPLTLAATQPEGLLTFSLPRGDHQVTLRHAPLPGERESQILSAAAALAVLGIVLFARTRKAG